MELPKLPRRYNATPLRYPGGKTGFAQTLIEIIRANHLSDHVYVEPYAGGAGAGLYLLLHEHVRSIVINDLDRAIYAFWNTVVSNPSRLIEAILSCELTIDFWREQFNIFRSASASEFELAFATLYLNRTNRSGILTGGPIGGLSQSGNWKLDARFNRDALANRIRLIGRYSNRIRVMNSDGAELVADLSKNQNLFFYLDPPYVDKGSGLYLNSYTRKDHEALANRLNSLNTTNWILSYDDSDFVRNLYVNRNNKLAFSLPYQAHSRRTGSEICILSDSLEIPDSLSHYILKA